ncbi:MAG: hypothetical protein LBM41_05440 [Ruminococcus sp.]|nr:hypothetical protein [Ruminococcus sp.]
MTKSKPLFTIGGVIVVLILIWVAIRTIFPLPVKNAIEITEKEIVIDVIDTPYEADGFTRLDRLENGNWLYYVSIDSWSGNEYDDTFLYLLSEDFSVIDTLDFDYDVNGMYALNNGNFSVVKTTIDEEENYSHYLLEYNTDFEIVAEKPLKNRPEFYNDGYYYIRAGGGGLQILDEDLTLVKEYKLEEFPNARITHFVQSFNGEVYIQASLDDNNKYEFPTSYLLRPLNGGEDVKYTLASDVMGDIRGNLPGDERYDFYTLSWNLNNTLTYAFAKDIRGEYLYGINKDGSFEKIGNYVYGDVDSILFRYYQGEPFDGKRYYTDAKRDERTEPETLYLYEYTAEYPN